ncbi:MAG: 50S ribosomal protein L9 [Pseudomonadota bacterium]
MEVILLERVENLGQMGDVVKVKSGFARNYLLPQKKALRANDANKQVFEHQRADLEARNLERKKEAEAAAEKINGRSFVVIRQASESGALYGSVTTRDIADAASEEGVKIERSQVRIEKALKTIGIATVRISLHPDVSASVDINVARSEDEAERQARGENVLAQVDDADETDGEETEDQTAEFFDAETQAAVASEDEAEEVKEDNA